MILFSHKVESIFKNYSFFKKTVDKDKELGIIVFVFVEWSVGQGVKTPPFHGGNTGSNPVRTI